MRNNFFEFIWSDYVHWHLYLKFPTESSEDKNVKLSIGLWKLFLSIGFWPVAPRKDNWDVSVSPQYGICYFEHTLMIYRGGKPTLFIDMPWQWQIVRHDLLLPDGSVYMSNRWNRSGKQIDEHYYWYEILSGWDDKKVTERLRKKCTRQIKIEHYTKDGRKQEATITLTGEEREWRWRWFTWFPFINNTQRVVSCDSDIELGKKAGSWKGGLMGWGCDWDINESMEGSFRRWYDKWDGN
jgi:hypothetical protein